MKSLSLLLLLFLPFVSVNASQLTIFDQSGKKHSLTREQLLSLPQHEISTELPWIEGQSSYSGVDLNEVLKSIDVSMSKHVTLVALNDYKISVPNEDFEKYKPIIAIKQDGEFMSVRDKGPFWLIYPLSSKPDINNTDFHAKMIWQIRDIHLSR